MSRKFWTQTVFGRTAALLFCIATASYSQTSREVRVPVLVTDRTGTPVAGLTLRDFRVVENGVEQVIDRCSYVDSPISTAIVLDASASRAGDLAQAKQDTLEYVGTIDSGEELILLQFVEPPGVVAKTTMNLDVARQLLNAIKPGGPSPVFDAILHAGNLLAKREQSSRKVILVNSDGADNMSHCSFGQLEALAGVSDILIYGIGPPNIPDTSGQRNPIAELARLTGGQYLTNGSTSVGVKLARSIRGRYTIEYRSSRPPTDRRYRTLKIEVRKSAPLKDLKLLARPGYYPQ